MEIYLPTSGIINAKMQQQQLHHLMGWSACDQHSAHLAWQPNKSAWYALLQCTNSTHQQHVIKPQFCIPLCTLNCEIDFTQHSDFITMIEKLDFAPILENSPS